MDYPATTPFAAISSDSKSADAEVSGPRKFSQQIADMRISYTKSVLMEKDVLPDPVEQFSKWFDEIRQAEIPGFEPNAMTLATCTKCVRVFAWQTYESYCRYPVETADPQRAWCCSKAYLSAALCSSQTMVTIPVTRHSLSFQTEPTSRFWPTESRKGSELLENPQAALVFFWAPMQRQVGSRC